MMQHWFSKLAFLTLTLAALAFVTGPAWAQHGGGHGGGGGHGVSGGAHFVSGGGGHWSEGGAHFSGPSYHGYPYYGYRHGFYGGYYFGFPWYLGWGGFYPYSGSYYPYYGSGAYFDSGPFVSKYTYDSTFANFPDYSYGAPSASSTSLEEVNTTTTPQTPPQPSIDDNAVLIGLRVPENAEVWIDGDKTTQTGTFREYVTPPLEPGQKFNYDIKARWVENGKEVIRERKLSFYAGDRLMVNLVALAKKARTQPPPPAPIP